MKLIVLCSSLILCLHLSAQSDSNNIWAGTYDCPKDTMGNIIKLILKDNQRFELFVDNVYDCIRDYMYYGEGTYKISSGEYLELSLDSILHAPSFVKIDTLDTPVDYGVLNIKVFDHQGVPLNDVLLTYCIPKTRFGVTRTIFPKRTFNTATNVYLTNRGGPHHLVIEKAQYQTVYISLEKFTAKKYEVSVTMNPEPKVKSMDYLSPGSMRLSIASSQALLWWDHLLTRESDLPQK